MAKSLLLSEFSPYRMLVSLANMSDCHTVNLCQPPTTSNRLQSLCSREFCQPDNLFLILNHGDGSSDHFSYSTYDSVSREIVAEKGGAGEVSQVKMLSFELIKVFENIWQNHRPHLTVVAIHLFVLKMESLSHSY